MNSHKHRITIDAEKYGELKGENRRLRKLLQRAFSEITNVYGKNESLLNLIRREIRKEYDDQNKKNNRRAH